PAGSQNGRFLQFAGSENIRLTGWPEDQTFSQREHKLSNSRRYPRNSCCKRVQLFQYGALCFRKDKQHHKELRGRHCRKLRKQFEYNGKLNVIPPNELNSASKIMLQRYVPQPNQMSGMMGMTMNGQPHVIGPGKN